MMGYRYAHVFRRLFFVWDDGAAGSVGVYWFM